MYQFTTGENVLWKSIIPPCSNTGALYLISCPNWPLFLFKLHSNRIMCGEVGSDDFGIIYQTSSVVKSFISFSITVIKSSPSSAFIYLPKCGLSFWEVSAAIILESTRLIDQSPELKFIRSMWSMVALKNDTFYNSFW